jgi:CheY-like chemotaxis protein
VLEHEGYEVRTAADAEGALRVLSLRIPWLVLIGVQLPGMDGLELTRRLRGDPATKRSRDPGSDGLDDEERRRKGTSGRMRRLHRKTD